MEDIAKVIYNLYSNREIPPDSELKKIMANHLAKDTQLRQIMSKQQRQLFANYLDVSAELEFARDNDLIKFVLNFVSSIINYCKKND